MKRVPLLAIILLISTIAIAPIASFTGKCVSVSGGDTVVIMKDGNFAWSGLFIGMRMVHR
jgi:hypothetical protein